MAVLHLRCDGLDHHRLASSGRAVQHDGLQVVFGLQRRLQLGGGGRQRRRAARAKSNRRGQAETTRGNRRGVLVMQSLRRPGAPMSSCVPRAACRARIIESLEFLTATLFRFAYSRWIRGLLPSTRASLTSCRRSSKGTFLFRKDQHHAGFWRHLRGGVAATYVSNGRTVAPPRAATRGTTRPKQRGRETRPHDGVVRVTSPKRPNRPPKAQRDPGLPMRDEASRMDPARRLDRAPFDAEGGACISSPAVIPPEVCNTPL